MYYLVLVFPTEPVNLLVVCDREIAASTDNLVPKRLNVIGVLGIVDNGFGGIAFGLKSGSNKLKRL